MNASRAPWRQAAIVAVLRQRGPMTVEQLGVVLGGSVSSLHSACTRLQQAGRIDIAGTLPSGRRGPDPRLYRAANLQPNVSAPSTRESTHDRA